jgi:hypothetical protein
LHGGERVIADKDEVPGSSPGRPTQQSSRSERCRQRAGSARCRLGPRRGRTPIPAGTSSGPFGAAHPAVRLGDDHAPWSRPQPEDGSHAAGAATSRCSLPLVPTAQPPATGAPYAGLACLVAQRARAAGAARTQPGGPGPPPTSHRPTRRRQRRPRPGLLDRRSSRRRPGSHRGLHPFR